MKGAAEMLLGFPVRRLGFRFRQRGFTLIELAIVMAVVGLVLGASLVPLRALDEARQMEDERRRLEVVRDAIVGYAMRHRTRARAIRFVIEHTTEPAWVFRLPGGRPYLPCPDHNGDGFEDRHGFVQGVDSRPGMVTANLGEYNILAIGGPVGRAPGRALYWLPPSPYPPGRPEIFRAVGRPHGECAAAKGAAPWRTLGISPTDGWGNRHTYYADPVFSNAMFGFDRQTIADLHDPRLPSAPGFEFAPRYLDYVGYPGFLTNGCPAVICDGGRAADNGTGCAGDWAEYSRREGSTCGPFLTSDQRLPADDLRLKAGAVARTRIDAAPGKKRFLAGDVTDGLPFVLVSHGPNGRFAVNHWATLAEPVAPMDLPDEVWPVCNHVSGAIRNGRRYPNSVSDLDRALLHEGVNGNRLIIRNLGGGLYHRCGPVARIRANGELQSTAHLSFFVWEPPGLIDRGEFDDQLLWMTREELAGAITGDIPPLPRMVIAYFP